MNWNSSFFARVDQCEFRGRLNRSPGCDIRRGDYETVIYDNLGDILAIMHAASIDESGRCHPTEYFLRRIDPPPHPARLVA